jgi:hypothetical protein
MGPIAYYRADFLEPAHPVRMATEPRSIPRLRNPDATRMIWPTATKAEIAQGYRLVPGYGLHAHEMWKRPLRRLDHQNYSWFKHQVSRRSGGKRPVNWIFATYDDHASVNFIQFDFDRHYHNGATPEDHAEIEHYFKQQVQILRDIALEQNLDLVWTTSPGDIDAITGKHIQGLYAWLKLDRHYKVEELRGIVAAFKAYHCLEVECCWDVTHRNVRLPGQEFVEVADPETVAICKPVEKRQRETLEHFAIAWAAAKPADSDKLFGPCVCWAEKPAQVPTAAIAALPEPETPSKPKPRSSAPQASPVSRDELVKEPNTFKAATKARICSRLVRHYRGQRAFFNTAVEQAMVELRKVRAATSRTCSDPDLLRATTTRWMEWYFARYDAKKAGRGRTLSDEDRNDEKRISYCKGLSRKLILQQLKHRNLSYREKQAFSKFLDIAEKWNFRVAAKAIYGSHAAVCQKALWFRLMNKLKGILVILVEKNPEARKCRQWGLAASFVNQMHATEQFVSKVLSMHKKEEEKKEKLVYGQAISPLPSNGPTGAPIEASKQVWKELELVSSEFVTPTAS